MSGNAHDDHGDDHGPKKSQTGGWIIWMLRGVPIVLAIVILVFGLRHYHADSPHEARPQGANPVAVSGKQVQSQTAAANADQRVTCPGIVTGEQVRFCKAGKDGPQPVPVSIAEDETLCFLGAPEKQGIHISLLSDDGTSHKLADGLGTRIVGFTWSSDKDDVSVGYWPSKDKTCATPPV